MSVRGKEGDLKKITTARFAEVVYSVLHAIARTPLPAERFVAQQHDSFERGPERRVALKELSALLTVAEFEINGLACHWLPPFRDTREAMAVLTRAAQET